MCCRGQCTGNQYERDEAEGIRTKLASRLLISKSRKSNGIKGFVIPQHLIFSTGSI